jgi:hypothetical protein
MDDDDYAKIHFHFHHYHDLRNYISRGDEVGVRCVGYAWCCLTLDEPLDDNLLSKQSTNGPEVKLRSRFRFVQASREKNRTMCT